MREREREFKQSCKWSKLLIGNLIKSIQVFLYYFYICNVLGTFKIIFKHEMFFKAGVGERL